MLLINQRKKMNNDAIQLEYEELRCEIQKNMSDLSKHDKIRVSQWLQKLEINTNNEVWKKNRNFYLKVLSLMIHQQQLIKPFTQNPPEGPLPKLTLYDIDYPIRQKIQEESKKSSIKKRSKSHKSKSIQKRGSSQHQPYRKGLQNDSYMVHKKKIIFDEYVTAHEKYDQNGSIFGNLNKTMKTQDMLFNSFEQPASKKLTKKFPEIMISEQQPKQKQEEARKQKAIGILKRTVKLLGQHFENLSEKPKYRELLQKIVTTGDDLGEDLRQVRLKSEQSIRFDKYGDRIKEKICESDLNSIQFLEYLKKSHSLN